MRTAAGSSPAPGPFPCAKDGLDLVGEQCFEGQIDSLIYGALHGGETLAVDVAGDDAEGAQQMGGGGGAPADGSCTRDIDCRAVCDACLDAAVKARGQNVGEQCQILDLRQRLILVGEAEQVPIGVGNYEMAGLSALTAAEIESVDAAIDRIVDVHAGVGMALLAVAAPLA